MTNTRPHEPEQRRVRLPNKNLTRWKNEARAVHDRAAQQKAAQVSYDIVNEILDEPPITLSSPNESTGPLASQHSSSQKSRSAITRQFLGSTGSSSRRRISRLMLLLISMVGGACIAFAMFRALGLLPESNAAMNTAVTTVLRPIAPSLRTRAIQNDIADVEFFKLLPKDVSLASFVSRFANRYNIPVTLDVDSLTYSRASLRTAVPVNLALGIKGSTASVFADTLAPLGLACVDRNDQIVVSAVIDDQHSRVALHDVSDLLTKEETGPDIVQLITEFVGPNSWKKAGGIGEIQLTNDVISITNTNLVHRDVLIFCEMLRRAQGLPLISHVRLPMSIGTIQKSRRRLQSTPVALYQDGSVPLVEMLAMLEKSCGCTFLVDWQGLESEQLRFEDCRVAMNDNLNSLSDVLKEITAQLGVAYRLVDVNTIEITTKAEELRRRSVLIHHIPPDLPLTSIKSELETVPNSQEFQEGERILVDEKSRLVIALLPQSRHVSLSEILDR